MADRRRGREDLPQAGRARARDPNAQGADDESEGPGELPARPVCGSRGSIELQRMEDDPMDPECTTGW